MNLADLSIERPTFITCVVLVMLAVGLLAMQRLGVDLFPDVTFPVVTVTTPYPGAGPAEIETLVSKPLEDEISTLAGIKRLTSINYEGVSRVIAEFTLETDVKYAEQQIRDRVGATKNKLPRDVKESTIRRIDPADQPILILALNAEDLRDEQIFDVADQIVRPKLEQVNQVGLVEIIGGRKRQIHVALDRNKLKAHEISVLGVAGRIASSGENVPSGKIDQADKETVFRSIGEYRSVEDIKHTVLNFFGSEVPTTVADVGQVIDTTEDEKSRAYLNGKKAVFVYVFRQTGSNTIAVVDAVKKQIGALNATLAREPGKPALSLVRDGSVWIHVNVDDVKDSILMGIALAVLVVFFFLGNGRSTIITGLALPNSLIGAFVLMSMAGFTINIMTLLALSLSVGLLIDDAIVVRENIFRHIEMGKSPIKAAREGTAEVRLAVIATTLTVIAVFGPVGFLKGVTGQFFKQFGLTICFAMAISLFDALTIAPMLSAYFAGMSHDKGKKTLWDKTIGVPLAAFDRFQTWLENKYESTIRFTLKRPLFVLGASFLIFLGSCGTVKFIPKTFLPPQDAGEFTVGLDMPPGTNLEAMNEAANKVDKIIRENSEVAVTALSVGGQNGQTEVADFYVRLIPAKQRKANTIQIKERIREQLKPLAYCNPKVKDYDAVGGGQRPFNVNLIGLDQKELERVGDLLFQELKKHPGLKDVDTSFRAGKPEFQVIADTDRSKRLGISSRVLGDELRAQVEGIDSAKFREKGREYDIRVRLQDSQRDLKAGFNNTYVPNINNNLVLLKDVAKGTEAMGPATINRQDRGRLITISADITPGAGLGDVMKDTSQIIEEKIKLPLGMRYAFVGQAENFSELGSSVMLAMGFGLLFIFLVLASLYESFVTPFTIMLALPLAICGSFVALWIGHESLNIFSMIGTIMLLGVASKNSILLVDYANQQIHKGMDRSNALIAAGKARLRPILMTTMALIAGTMPVALGLNEASRQRTSMGVSIIGGLISSTLLTLIVVPAAFSFIDRFRIWSNTTLKNIFTAKKGSAEHAVDASAASQFASENGRSKNNPLG
ncbi:MAG: efflux RND transporter permease subunit [Bdellovibrio sp.]|nr:efflux RND transporter permease subunit [Bdellovibrio sp.]